MAGCVCLEFTVCAIQDRMGWPCRGRTVRYRAVRTGLVPVGVRYVGKNKQIGEVRRSRLQEIVWGKCRTKGLQSISWLRLAVFLTTFANWSPKSQDYRD